MPAKEVVVEVIAADPSVSSSRGRRRWLQLLVLFWVGGLGGLVARSYLFSSPSVQVTQPPSEVTELLPQASYSPEQVVQAQVESVREAVNNPAALLICYSFASPSNRQLTGPFERFAEMVTTEPYRQLGVCQDFQVGSAVMDGSTATVLVSALAENGQGSAFVFVLSKQQEAPYRDIWMTDGVFPLLYQQSQIGQSQSRPGEPEPQLGPQLETQPIPNDGAVAL